MGLISRAAFKEMQKGIRAVPGAGKQTSWLPYRVSKRCLEPCVKRKPSLSSCCPP